MNKIGWCDLTFNPVWGCRNHCEYCYARAIAKRFGKNMADFECYYRWNKMGITGSYTKRAFTNMTQKIRNFKPTFLHSQFDKKLPKKSQRIFVGSMSEIHYWGEEWIGMVIEKVKQYSQHTFQFLTRYPEVYSRYHFPKNCWLGVTIADIKDYDYLEYEKFKISDPKNLKYISFEPLLCRPFANLDGIDWVIIGAETGNRKGKVIPKREWIDDIISYCVKKEIPFYIKNNLELIHPCNVKLFPEEVGL